MRREEIVAIAGALSDDRHKQVFEAAAELRSRQHIASLRGAVKSGNFQLASLLEGKLEGLQELFGAMKELSKEG